MKTSVRASTPRWRGWPSQAFQRELAERVATFDTLHAALDIAEVAADAKKPVEPVAAIYFDLTNRLGLAWMREKIAALPGGEHWQMLAKAAMQDDLDSLARKVTAEVVAGGGDVTATEKLIAAWQDRNRRAARAGRPAAGRTARGAGAGCRDAVGGAARTARPCLTVRAEGPMRKAGRTRLFLRTWGRS